MKQNTYTQKITKQTKIRMLLTGTKGNMKIYKHDKLSNSKWKCKDTVNKLNEISSRS